MKRSVSQSLRNESFYKSLHNNIKDIKNKNKIISAIITPQIKAVTL
ncbi:hypothetical protein [Helicobacter brantae]|nr:hypothetical protein [Helicobacter brantae]